MAKNTEKRITAKMVLDSTGYNSSIKGINSEMKKYESQMKLASQGIKSFGADSEKLKNVQESLSKQVELHTKKVDIYKQALEKTTLKLSDNIKKRDGLKSSLESANKKYDEAVKLYGRESKEAKNAKENVDKLKQAHESAEKAVESNAKQVQGYETKLNKAKSQMVKTQGELKKVNDELDTSTNKWAKASQKLEDHSKKLKTIGKNMSDFGGKLTTHVSLPLMGIGVLASKIGMDFESEMSKVKAISGATGEDFVKLKNIAEEMGAKTKFSATQSAEGLEYMAMAGWKTDEMLAGLPPILNLATAAGTDLGRTSDIVTDALTAFGLKAKDAGMFSDVLAVASSNANTNVEMMGATFQYAAPVAGALGYSVQDTALAIGLMANAGIKAEKAGTALRGGLTNLVNPTDKMAEVMDKYKISITEADGTMKPFRQLIIELREKLGGLDEATQASAVANIFGKEAMSGWLAVINGSDEDLNKLTSAIDNCEGATAKMAETMQDNAKGSITEMKSALEGAGIKVFEALAPHITNIANKVSELANRFSELSPETQEMIVKMGLLAVAGGPIISGIGKFTSGIGSITGGIGKVSGLLSGLTTATKGVGVATTGVSSATSLATTGVSGLGLAAKAGTLLLNPWVIGITTAAAGAYALHKHMSKEAIPTVNLFDKKVKESTVITNAYGDKFKMTTTKLVEFSDKTKKAVGGFMELNDGAKKQLTDLYVSSTKITNDTVTQLTSKYKEMGEQIKAGEDEKYKQRLESFKQFLNNNKTMSEQEKAEALQAMEEKHSQEILQTDGYVNKIQGILQKASNEKRALTSDEQKEINDIQEKMKENGVKNLSETEEESKAILGRLKDYGTRITAEQASEVIKNAEKQRQDSVQKATDQYNQTVAEIRKMCDEDKIISKEQADAMIADAERQKNESITKATDMKKSVVDKIKEMNADTLKNIHETDGSIKTKWETLKDWFNNVKNHVVRWIVTKTKGSKYDDADRNWAGNSYFRGGLTYLHDATGKNSNYELYDLPRGTRIFNHDASVDLVTKTAEQVANKVANSVLSSFKGQGGVNVTQNIYSPTPRPSEIARQTTNNLRKLALEF